MELFTADILFQFKLKQFKLHNDCMKNNLRKSLKNAFVGYLSVRQFIETLASYLKICN